MINENIKIFEIRDRCTCMPVMAIKVNGDFSIEENNLLKHVGFGNNSRDYVFLIDLNNMDINYDQFKWRNTRTLYTAHDYIINNFDSLCHGQVIDIEFINGETSTCKNSEVNHTVSVIVDSYEVHKLSPIIDKYGIPLKIKFNGMERISDSNDKISWINLIGETFEEFDDISSLELIFLINESI